jgi:hypothetical protein
MTASVESVWYARVRRRHPDTFDARTRGLVHELLAIAAGRAVPDELIETETRRVLDEIGSHVGIGPKP